MKQINRTALLAKIHIGKKELRLDDETYRDVLWRVTGKRSAKELSNDELRRVLTDMSAKGFVPKRKKAYQTPDVIAKKRSLIGKIEAMLADMNLPWSYADGMANTMFGVAKVQWLDNQKLYKLTQALAVYQARQKKTQEQAQKQSQAEQS